MNEYIKEIVSLAQSIVTISNNTDISTELKTELISNQALLLAKARNTMVLQQSIKGHIS